ncbi:MAG: 2-oxoacid:acceptor oxidoreductase subunit alpha [Desulfovermiculus sp.]|nr:2-oxoacid:acceptor oxidoreductase subunit alpha [Desulfovermiculus sp.]
MARPEGEQLMQGNEACAWGAIDAGARFFGGYPITPSSEIAEVCARELPQYGGIYMQMEDEIASIASIIGASLSGKKSLTATSGPGFSLMQENLGVGIYQEVPCVIVNVQRVGPATGLATRPAQADVMQARWGTHGDHSIIVLSPASVQEMYTLAVRAFDLAEKYRTPVILLADEVVGHMRENIALPDPEKLHLAARIRPTGSFEDYLPYQVDKGGIPPGVPPMAAYGDQHILHVTSSCHDETGRTNSRPQVNESLLQRLKDKIDKNLDDIVEVEHFGPEDSDILIIAFGVASRVAKEAIVRAQKEGIKVKLLRIITLWPFPETEVRDALLTTQAALVPEMNQGQIIREVQRTNRENIPVHPVSRFDGELITPAEILTRLREVAQS